MSYIPEEIVAQVIDRCDIVDIVSSYLPLKKAGRNFKALSPFKDEKTPSFVVSPDKQIFHCFSSGEGGNVITFIMKMERVEFPEAVQLLADKLGIEIPKTKGDGSLSCGKKQELYKVNESAVEYFHDKLLTGKDKNAEGAREYLKSRGVTLETVKALKLGYAADGWDNLLKNLRNQNISLSVLEKAGLIIAREKKDGFYDRFRHRIIFPIFDIRSRGIGFGARSLEDSDGAKYINSPETDVYVKGQHLYGFNFVKDDVAKQDQIIVVEGYMDFVLPYQQGVTNIVASLGTALTVEQIRLIRRYTKNVVLLFDTDQAGESAMIRSFDLLIEEGMNVKVAQLEEGEDPDSFIRKYGSEQFYDRIEKADTVFDYKLSRLVERYGKETIESRAKISNEMLSTINKYSNAVIKSEYTKRLANALKVEHNALSVELKKFSDAALLRDKKSAKENIQSKPKQERKAEYNILRVILEDQDYIESVQDYVDISDFRDDNVRMIVTKVYELYEQEKEVSTVNLMSSFEDQNILRVISSLVVNEDLTIENIDKIFKDCVQRIREDRVKVRRKEVLAKIREAEQSGDAESLRELKEEFNQLIKK